MFSISHNILFIYSSSLAIPGHVQFVFNVVEIPGGDGRHCARQGVCTGWLDSTTRWQQQQGWLDSTTRELDQKQEQPCGTESDDQLHRQINNLTLDSLKVCILGEAGGFF